MEFFFGMLFGALFALMLFGSSGLSSDEKRTIIEVIGLLDRHVDFIEAEERAGNVEYKGTRLERDTRELEERCDKDNSKGMRERQNQNEDQ